MFSYISSMILKLLLYFIFKPAGLIARPPLPHTSEYHLMWRHGWGGNLCKTFFREFHPACNSGRYWWVLLRTFHCLLSSMSGRALLTYHFPKKLIFFPIYIVRAYETPWEASGSVLITLVPIHFHPRHISSPSSYRGFSKDGWESYGCRPWLIITRRCRFIYRSSRCIAEQQIIFYGMGFIL